MKITLDILFVIVLLIVAHLARLEIIFMIRTSRFLFSFRSSRNWLSCHRWNNRAQTQQEFFFGPIVLTIYRGIK